jgi:predicted TIM-barrel fold metal-dependent hydrolase
MTSIPNGANLLKSWTSAEERLKIMIENPAALYDFNR